MEGVVRMDKSLLIDSIKTDLNEIKSIFSELLDCTKTLSEISFDEDIETQEYYQDLIKRAKACL